MKAVFGSWVNSIFEKLSDILEKYSIYSRAIVSKQQPNISFTAIYLLQRNVEYHVFPINSFLTLKINNYEKQKPYFRVSQ